MVDDILASLPDDMVLGDLDSDKHVSYELFQRYLVIQETIKTDIVINEDSTGKDLKEAIKALPVDIKLNLINRYRAEQKARLGLPEVAEEDDTSKTPVDRIWSDTALRRWLVKAVFTLFAVVILVVIGATVAVGFMTGTLTDGVLVNTIMNTAIEVAKVILGLNN